VMCVVYKSTVVSFIFRVNDDCFICDVHFPPDRVFSLLTKLNPRTSGGPDGLSAMF